MKNWPALLALIATAGLGGSLAWGEEPPSQARIRVDVQMVSVSVAQALHLVPALRDRKTAPAAWTQLQKMIGDGKATLIDWPVVWSESGQRVVTQSVVEYRYATEPMPPNPPQPFSEAELKEMARLYPWWGAFTPSAFETRNVGASLEIESLMAPGYQLIDLSLVSSYLRFAGFRQWRGQESPLGVSGVQQRPEFQSAKATTYLSIRRDEPTLVGVFVFAEPQPHVELHILHARWTLLPPSVPTFSNHP
ncbi:hypothetical protein CfE428DRAFT_3405 [Chthoniobacter flavus Ellin428]|uniref:Uncharacterized protein n=1 Tax=Chthoniobacter flavus Ellin428 TaxID=497964 RepID=B4D3B7_9BACT|nr:hypothetical protein [Chthoniobacter flavus]EDY19228.1 hypothetical protein CfE428DRAFT_3405 [Chthoniobacter flavus Ellin428]TCO88071.1 hypothetical protein EV701_119115 [Chthoniobacter flavus]